MPPALFTQEVRYFSPACFACTSCQNSWPLLLQHFATGYSLCKTANYPIAVLPLYQDSFSLLISIRDISRFPPRCTCCSGLQRVFKTLAEVGFASTSRICVGSTPSLHPLSTASHASCSLSFLILRTSPLHNPGSLKLFRYSFALGGRLNRAQHSALQTPGLSNYHGQLSNYLTCHQSS